MAVTAFVMITEKGVCFSGLGTSSSCAIWLAFGWCEERVTCEVVEEVVRDGAFLQALCDALEGELSEGLHVPADPGQVGERWCDPWYLLSQSWEATRYE